MFKNNKYSKEEILEIYKSCWNSLESINIQPFLNENVEYSSMWVFETIVGKQAFLNYFNGKLNTLKNKSDTVQIQSKLCLASTSTSEDLVPCLVINQRFENGNEQNVSLFIEVEDELITKINLCDMNYLFVEFKAN